MIDNVYGNMIRFNRSDGNDHEIIHRIPLNAPTSQINVVEVTLQNLLFRNPQTLPIRSIDAAYDAVVPVCRELNTLA